ncbi:ABC transporter substrate-binding protein [Acetonema longum]|nr:ABC transporter substrate-binding protein [Acetonema longum]
MNSRIGRIIGILIMGALAVGAVLSLQMQPPAVQPASTVMRPVTDSAGRVVQIPVRPQRVIVLNPSSLDLFYAAGGKVVGRPTTQALPDTVKTAVAAVPEVGTTANPNVEKLIALEPDLVLGVNVPPHHQLVPVLEKAGIPILLQMLDNYQQILDTLRFYGELTGRPEQSAAVIKEIEDDYRRRMANRGSQPAPEVLLVWGSTTSFQMATSNSFAGDLLRRLGAHNMADSKAGLSAKMSSVPLSLEYVSKSNPDVILLITHSSDTKVGEKFRAELAGHPAWQGLKAVSNNRVHQLPYHLFAVNPGTRVGEAVAVLERLVYPEAAR